MQNIFKSSISLVAALGACFALSACAVEGHPDRSSKAQAQAGGARELPRVMGPSMKGTMSRHAQHAAALTLSVALGDYEGTSSHVSELLAEPMPAPPSSQEPSALNQQLPTKLFELNERFRTALGKLQGAARARDDEQTLLQFAGVVRSCRVCHRTLKSSVPPR